jgi:uncharacterized protein YfaS (alpha-2-macroglobulin family)
MTSARSSSGKNNRPLLAAALVLVVCLVLGVVPLTGASSAGVSSADSAPDAASDASAGASSPDSAPARAGGAVRERFEAKFSVVRNSRGQMAVDVAVAGVRPPATVNPKLKPTSEMLHARLRPGEGPFDLGEAPEGSAVVWRRDGLVSILTFLDGEAFADYFQRGGKIVLNWAEGMEARTALRRPFSPSYDRVLDPGNLALRSGRGGTSVLEAAPFTVGYRASRNVDDLEVEFRFNRPMVEASRIGAEARPEEWPAVMRPGLASAGSWLSPNRFVARTPGFSDRKYQDEVVGTKFSVANGPLDRALTGEKVPAFGSRGEVLDPFRLLQARQNGFDDQGRALVELFFNKEVSLGELKSKLSYFLVSASGGSGGAAGDRGPLEKPLPGVALEGVGRPGSGDRSGLEARLAAPLENGANLRVRAGGLASRDRKSSLTFSEDVKIVNDLRVRDSEAGFGSRSPYEPFFRVAFSGQIFADGAEKFVETDPPLPLSVSVDYDGLTVRAPFRRGEPARVVLRRGLAGPGGSLAADQVLEVRLPEERAPQAGFTGRGRYLSAELPLLVKLTGRDADSVRIDGWRLREESLPELLNIFIGGADLEESQKYFLARSLAARVVEREARIKPGPDDASDGGAGDAARGNAGDAANGSASGDPDEFARLVDLGSLLPGGEARTGAYLLQVTPLARDAGGGRYFLDQHGRRRAASQADGEVAAHWDLGVIAERYLPLVITDLGLQARTTGDGVSVLALSLSEAAPVPGAEVVLYDRSGAVLSSGTTDSSGLYRARGAEAARGASLAIAKKDGDLTYLMLAGQRSGSSYGWSSGDSGGRGFFDYGAGRTREAGPGAGYRDAHLGSGYEALVFFPRDLFRPGETLVAKAIVRDAAMLPPAGEFPLVWRVVDPDGRVHGERAAVLTPEGGLELEFPLPVSAPSGNWRVLVALPGSPDPLGEALLTVGDFLPPRLRLELLPLEKVVLGTGAEAALTGRATYLFGAEGAGLDWSLSARAAGVEAEVPGFSGWLFGVDPASFSLDLGVRQGKLDGEGLMRHGVPLPGDPEELPAEAVVSLAWQVMEDGGRWNEARASLVWRPSPVLAGVRVPPGPAAGTRLELGLAAVLADGKPAGAGSLDVRVGLVRSRGFGVVRHGRLRGALTEEQTEVFGGRVALGPDGRGMLALENPESGLYEIAARAPGGGVLRRRFHVGSEAGESGSGRGRAPALAVSLDKTCYLPGDVAQVVVTSPFDGAVWVTLETDKLLFSEVGRVSGGVYKTTLTVPPEIVQNAALTASAVRPLAAGTDGWLAAGRVSLEADRSPRELAVEASLAARLSPAKRQTLSISLKDRLGAPVSGEVAVALVDEGILALSGYPVPDPLGFFGRGRRFPGGLRDVYDLLLPPEREAALPYLAAGGGDDGEGGSSLFSPFKRETELLSLFLATVLVGPDGLAEVELDIPEYSGSARLALTASSGGRFGFLSLDVPVGRDLTVEQTLPLAAAPGDRFVASVRIFHSPRSPEAGAPASSEPPATGGGDAGDDGAGHDGGDDGDAGAAMGAAPGSVEPEINFLTDGPLRIERVASSDGTELALPLRRRLAAGEAETVLVSLVAEPGGGSGDGENSGGGPGDEENSGGGPSDGPDAGGVYLAGGGGRAGKAPPVGPAALVVSVSGLGDDFVKRTGTVVRPPYARTARNVSGRIEASSTEIAPDYSGFLAGTTSAVLTLASSRAAEAARAALFLREYPYGCLEQTVSRGWAHLAALDYGALLGEEDEEKSLLALEGVLGRLMTMQTFQGGFASWPAGRSIDDLGTNYAAQFLVEAAKRIELPGRLLPDALARLERLFSISGDGGPGDLHVRAHALYVLTLAGFGNRQRLNYLKERSEGLGEAGLVFLAAAEALTDGRPDALEALDKNARGESGFPDEWYDYMAGPSRNRALRLMAWAGVDPLNPRTAELAGLVAEDGRLGRWRTTQENGVAALALSSYFSKIGAADPYALKVSDSRGRELASGTQLDPVGLSAGVMAALPDGRLTVEKTGPGKPFYSLVVAGVPLEAPAPVSKTLSLVRTWTMNGSGGPRTVVFAADGVTVSGASGDDPAPAGAGSPGPATIYFSRGGIVDVELLLESGTEVRNVVVADLVPGGFEVLGLSADRGGASGGGEDFRDYAEVDSEDGGEDYDGYDDYDDYVDESSSPHLEQREDRVVAVVPAVSGRTIIRYSMRAVTKGEFVVPPATAEGMYDPDRRAVLPEARVVVGD